MSDIRSLEEKKSELAEVEMTRGDPVYQSGKCPLTSHLCREAAVEGIPEVQQSEGKVFVKEVAEKLAHAIIGPAAVDQE